MHEKNTPEKLDMGYDFASETEWPTEKLEDNLFATVTKQLLPHGELRANKLEREVTHIKYELGRRVLDQTRIDETVQAEPFADAA